MRGNKCVLGSAHMLGLRRPKRFVRTAVRTAITAVFTVVTGIVAVVVVEWHREGTANQAHFDAICLFIHVLTVVDKERDEEFDRLDKCRDDLKKEIKVRSQQDAMVSRSQREAPTQRPETVFWFDLDNKNERSVQVVATYSRGWLRSLPTVRHVRKSGNISGLLKALPHLAYNEQLDDVHVTISDPIDDFEGDGFKEDFDSVPGLVTQVGSRLVLNSEVVCDLIRRHAQQYPDACQNSNWNRLYTLGKDDDPTTPRDTLDLTDEAGIDSVSSRISRDSGFVDPIRGHRLEKWVVRAHPGSRVTVLAESGELDVVLYVVLGGSDWYSDDGGRGTNSQLEFEMTGPDSTAYILVGSYRADAEGRYRLRVGPQARP